MLLDDIIDGIAQSIAEHHQKSKNEKAALHFYLRILKQNLPQNTKKSQIKNFLKFFSVAFKKAYDEAKDKLDFLEEALRRSKSFQNKKALINKGLDYLSFSLSNANELSKTVDEKSAEGYGSVWGYFFGVLEFCMTSELYEADEDSKILAEPNPVWEPVTEIKYITNQLQRINGTLGFHFIRVRILEIKDEKRPPLTTTQKKIFDMIAKLFPI